MTIGCKVGSTFEVLEKSIVEDIIHCISNEKVLMFNYLYLEERPDGTLGRPCIIQPLTFVEGIETIQVLALDITRNNYRRFAIANMSEVVCTGVDWLMEIPEPLNKTYPVEERQIQLERHLGLQEVEQEDVLEQAVEQEVDELIKGEIDQFIEFLQTVKPDNELENQLGEMEKQLRNHLGNLETGLEKQLEEHIENNQWKQTNQTWRRSGQQERQSWQRDNRQENESVPQGIHIKLQEMQKQLDMILQLLQGQEQQIVQPKPEPDPITITVKIEIQGLPNQATVRFN